MTEQPMILEISPAQAKAWLDSNHNNRPVRESRVKDLVRHILDGRWRVTNDAISFTGTALQPGRLLNGQHRLNAIVLADAHVPCLVMFGVSETSFEVMDTGARRQAHDLISEHNASTIASAARVVRGYIEKTISMNGRSRSFNNDEVMDTLRDHPEIKQTVSDLHSRVRTFCTATSGVMAGISLLRIFDPKMCESFIEALASGDRREPNDPAILLREKLIYESLHTKRRQPEAFAGMVIKAYNSEVGGLGLVRIQSGSDEGFPEILDRNNLPKRPRASGRSAS